MMLKVDDGWPHLVADLLNKNGYGEFVLGIEECCDKFDGDVTDSLRQRVDDEVECGVQFADSKLNGVAVRVIGDLFW